MSFSTSVWNAATADWSLGEPGSATTNLAALFDVTGRTAITIDIGAIAPSGSAVSTVGLRINDVNEVLDVDSGGTLAVGHMREGRMLSAKLPKATRRVRLLSRRFVPAQFATGERRLAQAGRGGDARVARRR